MDEQLKEVFATALDLETDEIEEDCTQDSLEDWDSLGHLNLISEIEKIFKVKVTMDEVMEMTTYAKVKKVVSDHLEKVSN
jgi:acyl carrier protein